MDEISRLQLGDRKGEYDQMVASQRANANVVTPIENNPLVDEFRSEEIAKHRAAVPRLREAVEDIEFETTDELLLWVLEHRKAGEQVILADDPMNRHLGFSAPGAWAHIGLPGLKGSPPSVEVLDKFGPVPEEVQAQGRAVLATLEGRHWLATGKLRSKEVPDASELDAIWAAESEDYRPDDEGEILIDRPPAGVYVTDKDGKQVRQVGLTLLPSQED